MFSIGLFYDALTARLRELHSGDSSIVTLYSTESQEVFATSSPSAIEFRQDADGRWHYPVLGEFAAQHPVLGGVVERLAAHPGSSFQGTMGKSERERVYVSAEPVGQEFGLAVTALVVVPQYQFVEPLVGGRLRSLLVALGVAACMAVAAALLSFFVFSRPLGALSERLRRQRTLSDSGASWEAESRIRELRSIQVAYGELAEELGRLKSFVPDPVRAEAEAAVGQAAGGEGADACAGDAGREAVVAAPAAPPCLHTVRPVSFRMASVVQLSVRDHLLAVGTMAPGKVEAAMASLVSAVVGDAKACGGVVDTVYGDSFTLSFNAASDVAEHRESAVRCALGIARAVQATTPFAQGVCCGVASGQSMAGNFGGASHAHFCTLGAATRNAADLAAYCHAAHGSDVQVVVASSLLQGFEHKVLFEALNLWWLMGSTKDSVLLALYDLVDYSSPSDIEYLVLEDQRSKYEDINKAFVAMRDGDLTKAREHYIRACDAGAPVVRLRTVLKDKMVKQQQQCTSTTPVRTPS